MSSLEVEDLEVREYIEILRYYTLMITNVLNIKSPNVSKAIVYNSFHNHPQINNGYCFFTFEKMVVLRLDETWQGTLFSVDGATAS